MLSEHLSTKVLMLKTVLQRKMLMKVLKKSYRILKNKNKNKAGLLL